jgi:hypothetical protein
MCTNHWRLLFQIRKDKNGTFGVRERISIEHSPLIIDVGALIETIGEQPIVELTIIIEQCNDKPLINEYLSLSRIDLLAHVSQWYLSIDCPFVSDGITIAALNAIGTTTHIEVEPTTTIASSHT